MTFLEGKKDDRNSRQKVFRRTCEVLLDLSEADGLLHVHVTKGSLEATAKFLKLYFGLDDRPDLPHDLLLTFLKCLARRGSSFIRVMQPLLKDTFAGLYTIPTLENTTKRLI